MLKSDLKQRFELVYNFLLKEKTEISNLEEMKTYFCDALEKSCLEQNTKIVLIYLVLLARYPSEEEIEDTTYTINKIKIEDLINQIILEEEFKDIISNSNQYHLKLANSETLYVDVTHTSQYQSNTGIQRVVRSLCSSFKENHNNIQLFKVDNNGRPQILSPEDTEYFYSWNDRLKVNKVEKNNANIYLRIQFHKMFNIIKNTIKVIEFEYKKLKLLRRKLQDTYQKFFLKNKFEKNIVNEIPVFIYKNQEILIPELVCESSRIEFYKSISSLDLEIKLNMIVYDLIPVYSPKYVVSDLVSAFVEYLTLLPYIQKVSCISKHVKEELTHFSQPLSQKPIIEYHLLGDEKKYNQTNNSIENNNSIAKILCVATIEPRKNQINVLRAAKILWEEGHIFELQFVGTMGWKNEIFRRELETAERKYKVKYYKHVSDEVLNEMYKQAFFTIFVSHIEGFGLPILESLNHGKPCITSNNSSMKEIAEMTGGCLLVDPTSIEEISEAMKELLNNKEKYQELKNQADNLKWHSRDDYAKSIYSFIMNES